MVVNTAYTERTGTLCRPFFSIICFFYNFCTLSENFSVVRWNLFCEFVITLFFVSIGTYWGKIKNDICGRKIIFIPFSESARKTSAWWSTRHTLRQYEFYADQFSELFVLFTIFVLWAKFYRNSLKIFRRVCNHIFPRIHRNVLRKNKKWHLRKENNFYTILGEREENFGVVVNTAYTETIGILCRPIFWIICFVYNFCTLSEIL